MNHPRRLAVAIALALATSWAAWAASEPDDVGRVEVTGQADAARLGGGMR
jgi:predicted amidohydrolase YtcJ